MKIKIGVILGFVCLALGALFFGQPTVSVIMATWNRKDMARQAIESILNQTYTDFELIIVDDASTDGTADVVAEYAAKDRRIIAIYNKKNKGLVYNLNTGLSRARGKYIARMDDDDIAFPERFEKQVAFLNAHPETTVLGTRIASVETKQTYTFHKEVNPELFHIKFYVADLDISHPSIMMRRDFLKKHQIWYTEKYKYAEDRVLYADIIKAGGHIHSLPDVLLYYRYFSSKKPANYGKKQAYSVYGFHADYFKVFVPMTLWDFYKTPKCDRLRHMERLNPEKRLVNQEVLEQYIRQECDSSNENK